MMSSFVNLMADDVWSEADIIRRSEAIIRSEFSLEAEAALNRKFSALALDNAMPSEADQAEMTRYRAVVAAAEVAGDAARADMVLLAKVFPLEAAQRRLDRMALSAAWDRLQQPELAPLFDEAGAVTNTEALAQDEAERATAEAVVSPCRITAVDGQQGLVPDALALDRAEREAAAQVLVEADPVASSLLDLRRHR